MKDGSTVGQCWLKTLGNLTQTDNCKPGGGYSCTSGKVKNHFPALGPYDVTWSEIGTDVVNSTVHQEIAYQAALQSMVLLKNGKGAGQTQERRTDPEVGAGDKLMRVKCIYLPQRD